MPDRSRLQVVPRAVEESLETPVRGLMWSLGLGAFGLAWSITTVAAYLPTVLGEFTHSATLIGLVLAAEGLFAFFMPLFVGPMSDATHLPLGEQRPSWCSRSCPWRSLALLPFMPGFQATRSPSSASSSRTTSTSRPTAASIPTSCRTTTSAGRRASSVLRGTALGAALVGGGFLLSVWEPFPFILAAGVTLVSCGAVVVLVHEKDVEPTRFERFRSILRRRGRRPPREARAPLPDRQHGLGGDLRGDADPRRPLHHRRARPAALRLLDGARRRRGRLRPGRARGGEVRRRVRRRQRHPRRFGRLRARAPRGRLRADVALVVLRADRSGGDGGRRGDDARLGSPLQGHAGDDRGTITGLATTTKGLGLVIGPLAAGAAIDIFHSYFRSTDGYAVIWPVVAIPVLAVIPLVALLAEAEGDVRGTARRRAS